MNTQIFATMGPACGTENIIKDMIDVGMTGMRLNLSHTTLPDSKDYIEAYRNAAQKAGIKPQILIDMQGPELRVGDLAKPWELVPREKVVFGINAMNVPDIIVESLNEGDQVLLDDGKILLEVVDQQPFRMMEKQVMARVLRGGTLHSHKSIKIVGKDVPMPVLTEHDIQNIKVAKDYGVTALMQPFVRSGEDLRAVRNILAEQDAVDVQIFAKIENRTGVANMDSIIPEADVIVIARGDLGNDMPLWELPKVQKEIKAACKKYNKPYIVVTQMLASMEHNPVPTRAEVSDIFHAVYHGAWGVMVTGETAVGEYPVEVIKYLTNTAKSAFYTTSSMLK